MADPKRAIKRPFVTVDEYDRLHHKLDDALALAEAVLAATPKSGKGVAFTPEQWEELCNLAYKVKEARNEP